jgi:uncharacterized protein YfkK (UPF0435 family)
MRKTPLAALVLLAALATTAAQAACIYPRAPENIPDGRTATYDEMVAAQKAVKQFDADIAAYNACLNMELQSLLARPDLDDARRAELAEMQVKKNNAAVDEAQAVADRFNEQLRAYKEANKK